VCAQAGRLRDSAQHAPDVRPSIGGYVFAVGSGIMSAIFNIGYTLALPVAETGQTLGHSVFASTTFIWLLMLGAGSIPNICFCLYLIRRNGSMARFAGPQPERTWGLAVVMGVLWGGSIFLYGAATPMLGQFGPSVGWPLSLAVALIVANFMGFLLGEWRQSGPAALHKFRLAMFLLFAAIVLCAGSAALADA
jgi:L-rhamnose-H+ transport protein